MPDLGILNTMIAMVIVILVLSLVVQSVQTLAKKVLKLKSRTIINSLEDLFEIIGEKDAASAPAGVGTKTPRDLVADVTGKLKELGRETLFGRPMLDSLSKDDLMKVLTRVRAADLLPDAVGKFQAVLEGLKQLEDELKQIDTTLLAGDTSAKFAAMKGAIMPLVHDLEALGEDGKIAPAVFFGDLYRLRHIKAADALDILGQIQQSVSQNLAVAKAASDEAQKALAEAQKGGDQGQIDAARTSQEDAAAKLKTADALDGDMKKIADRISALSNDFDEAFAPLLARLQQVEVWYDTVMQGFEERFTRHMRSVALVISVFVVVLLNANFFSIYRAIKSDPVKTALIVQQGPAILNTAKQETSGQGASTTNSAVNTARPTGQSTPPASSSTQGTAQTGASPSPAAVEKPVTVEDVKKEGEQVNDLVSTYESFGIKPLSRQQIRDAFAGNYAWRDLSETFFGWAIMVMLLSAGAPFWEDTLESLFGLKNLLRQRSDTKNVEEEKGGQPKP